MHDSQKQSTTSKLIQIFCTETAIILFINKSVPILTYRLEHIWQKLSEKGLITLGEVKTKYLKIMLGLPMNFASRLAYELTCEKFLIEDLRKQLHLPCMSNCRKFFHSREDNRKDIWSEFYMVDAMMNRQWTGPNWK